VLLPIYEASFCGQVYDIEDLAVVTDIREQVCRLGWTNKKYVRANEHTKLELLRARGYSLLYQYGRCPILGVLGRKILDLTDGVVIRESIINNLDSWEREKLRAAMKYGVVSTVVGDNTRHLVEKLYKISVRDQLDIEASLVNLQLGQFLPFQFDVVPPSWTEYWDRWCTDDYDPPSWIHSNDRALADNIIQAGIVLPSRLL